MLPLLWSLLNVILILAFLYACFQVFKVLRREIGLGLSLLFLLGLAAFKSTESEEKNGSVKNLLERSENLKSLGNWRSNQIVEMQNNSYNKLNILVEAEHTDSTLRPLGLYPSVSGIIIGHDWKPWVGLVNTKDGQLTYQVILLHDWKLMGIKLYTTSEEYAGTIARK